MQIRKGTPQGRESSKGPQLGEPLVLWQTEPRVDISPTRPSAVVLAQVTTYSIISRGSVSGNGGLSWLLPRLSPVYLLLKSPLTGRFWLPK